MTAFRDRDRHCPCRGSTCESIRHPGDPHLHRWLDMARVEEAEVWARKMRWGGTSEERMAQARSAMAAQSPQRAATLLDSAFGRDQKTSQKQEQHFETVCLGRNISDCVLVQ